MQRLADGQRIILNRDGAVGVVRGWNRRTWCYVVEWETPPLNPQDDSPANGDVVAAGVVLPPVDLPPRLAVVT